MARKTPEELQLENDVASSTSMSWGRYKPRSRKRTDKDREYDEKYRNTHKDEIKARQEAYYANRVRMERIRIGIIEEFLRLHPEEAKVALRVAEGIPPATEGRDE